jgi:hypothetical protein
MQSVLIHTLMTTAGRRLWEAGRDLMPILLVVFFFQTFVLREPFPAGGQLLLGTACVVAGLAFFIQGLEMGLFPIGEQMALAFSRKGSLTWLLVFGFSLGFGTTIAEPALIAVAREAGEVAAGAGFIEGGEQSISGYAFGLRITVAVSVGVAVSLGLIRIILGWPVHFFIIGGYVLIVVCTFWAPQEIIGIAYDSGGVTTSTVTVPLVTALGIGLATSIRHRNPLTDGFGLIAFASLFPILFVLLYGIILFGN